MADGIQINVEVTGAEEAAVALQADQEALQNLGSQATITASQLQSVGEATEKAATSTKGLSFATSGMIQEYVRMIRAVLTGQLERLPSELATATTRMGGLQNMTAATGVAFAEIVVPVALVGGSLAYVLYQQYELEKETTRLTSAMALFGHGADASSDSIKNQLLELERAPGVGTKAATAFLQLAAADASIDDEIKNQTEQLLPAFISALGDRGPAAAAKLAGELSNLTVKGFRELDHTLLNLSVTQEQEIERLIETGNQAQAVSEILQSLSERTGIYIKSLGDQVYDAEQKMKELNAELSSHVGADGIRLTTEELIRLNHQLDAEKEKLGDIRHLESEHGEQAKANAMKTELASAKALVDSSHELTGLEKTRDQFAKDYVDLLAQSGRDIAKITPEMKLLSQAWQDAQAKVDAYNKRVADQGASAAEKLSRETIESARATVNAEGVFGEQLLQKEINSDKQLIADRRITAKDRLEIEADLHSKIAGLNREEERDQQQEHAAEIRASDAKLKEMIVGWENYFKHLDVLEAQRVKDAKEATTEIGSAENTLVSDILTTNMSAGQILRQISVQLLEKELQDDLRYYTQKKIFRTMDLDQEAMNERGGLLLHQLTEAQKTAATVAGDASRTASNATAAVTGSALEKEAGSISVLNDAKLAFSGTVATVSQYLPPPFPELAGAAAFAAVAAYDTLASLDVGAWNVPHDMPAIIHAGETVLPKDFATGFRENGGGSGSGGSQLHLHINTLDTSTMASWANKNASHLAQAVRGYMINNTAFNWP